MNHKDSIQKAATKTRRAVLREVAVAERSVAQTGEQVMSRLLPHIHSVASELESAAGRTRRGYERYLALRPVALPPHAGPTAAQITRTHRRRAAGIISLGLLGLAGALALRRWRTRIDAMELFTLPDHDVPDHDDERPRPSEAVAAVSDRGVATAEAVDDGTPATGPGLEPRPHILHRRGAVLKGGWPGPRP